ncbi:hypothetical protein BT96DRAFT_977503 [Gymnopus androsaceus JB14]|uniref:DUF829-domain-containing protein n=1 Tax=Gymnopus androsaceus JB14 TaxID=1447944 RepID=A0A6A4HF72_9AGAR|nr:hypothetical protein BT96DRAFT_977503 [Gymnopus androsaceus JB14]
MSYSQSGPADASLRQLNKWTISQPSVILLFGWLDGQLNHLQKYVEHLRERFPTSTIVLVRSFSSFYWTSQSQRENLLLPIVEVLKNESRGGHYRGTLIDVMSNGGGFQFMTLRKLLFKLEASKAVFLPSGEAPMALILDSAPGDNALRSAISSMTPASPVIRILSIPPVVVVYAVFYIMNAYAGNPPIYSDLRTSLNSPILLPSVIQTTSSYDIPRLYLYSDNDKLSLEEDISRHAADAISKGFNVSVEKFCNTVHVSHARSNPESHLPLNETLSVNETNVSHGLHY